MVQPPEQTIPLAAGLAVVGIGSPHGSDRIGWQVVEALEQQLPSGVCLRKARIPLDIIDWLPELSNLHVVDGCVSDHHRMERYTVVWDRTSQNPSGDLVFLRGTERFTSLPTKFLSRNSHQLELFSVLRLAGTLGSFPKRLTLWAIPIPPSKRDSCAFSSALVKRATAAIMGEITRA